jgi:hypothetical protein
VNGSTAVPQQLCNRSTNGLATAPQRFYERLYNSSTTALLSPVQSPIGRTALHRLCERLCIVSTTGSTSSLRPALRRLYIVHRVAYTSYDWLCIVFTHGSTIAHTLPIQSSDECLHYRLYNSSTNDSANGSTIAHTIVHMNGSTTALPRLYRGSTNGSTDGSTNGSTNCSTVSYQRLYEWPCNGPAIAHKIVYTNGSTNGPAMALRTALQ